MSKVILSTVINIISGGTPKTSVNEYWDSGTIGWLSVNDFNKNSRFVYDSEKKITNLGVEKSNTKFLEKKDVIISARGTVGVLAQIGLPMCFNQSCFGLRGKRGILDNDFLYYSLKNYVKNIKKRSQGSVFDTINLKSFDLMEIDIPNKIDDQKKIAAVLSTLDSKIELNNRINTELEAIAKTLYDYWFVQFDFPDENGKPYKSSGGKMVYNEVLKREIPEGWGEVQLRNLFNCNYNSLGKNSSYNEIAYLDTSSLNKNNIESTQLLSRLDDKIPSRAQRVVSKNDILYSTVRPNLCHYGIIKHPVDNMVASTGFVQLSSKIERVSNDLLYTYLTSDWVTERLQQIATLSVSSYPSISSNDILNLWIALPKSKEILELVNSKFHDVYKKVSLNQKESQRLTELRDWLLPMLMNGQVSVG